MFDVGEIQRMATRHTYKDCRKCLDHGTLWRLTHHGGRVWMQPGPCECYIGYANWAIIKAEGGQPEFPDNLPALSPHDPNVLNVHELWIAEVFAGGREVDVAHLRRCVDVLGFDLDKINLISLSLADAKPAPRDGKSAASGE